MEVIDALRWDRGKNEEEQEHIDLHDASDDSILVRMWKKDESGSAYDRQ